MFLNQKIDHITKSNSTLLACTRPIIFFFIVRFIVKLINNSCKILEINCCNIKKKYTNDSDTHLEDGKYRR